MRKLERGQAPDCLQRYRHPDTWATVSSADKDALWQELAAMQHARCAYCESSIESKNQRHIEHFRTRQGSPRLCFSWDNLFGSCRSKHHCGHYKDSPRVGRYTAADLLKPDIDDPEEFLIFLADGSVRARSDLSERDKRRADETIRVLGLDDSRLRALRKVVVQTHSHSLNELVQIRGEFTPEELKMLAIEFEEQLDAEDCAAAAREQYRALFQSNV